MFAPPNFKERGNNMPAKKKLTKQQELTKQHREYLVKLKKEPKVQVRVDEIYAQYIGPKFSYLLNGQPVTLHCDGKPRMYPESVAENIYAKLSKIAKANKEVKINSKIFG